MRKHLKSQIGVWSLIDSFHTLRILLQGDIDFVVLDFEHGYWSRSQAALAVDFCREFGKYAVFRVPQPTQEWVQLAFDSNAHVLQVAGIRAQVDIDNLIQISNYPPHGNLGYSPWTSQGFGKKDPNVSRPVISIQIEDEILLKRFIEGTLNVPESIRSIFIGRYDLSVSMGSPGEIKSTAVYSLMESAIYRANYIGKSIGTVSSDLNDALSLDSLGFSFLSVGSDIQRLSDVNLVGDK